ncbi:hypothetical protein [Pseudoxanthomonas sp. 3HH-4]|uniref:hypothetical protein n=1 Tax=Pseudoxanthomonas sp. 3HH-4 TaxID=1690214 RepID=UPI0011546EFA|nr:hypothetical protein [Pseudoxanthomonas sp. 3HH-4]
MRRSSKTVFFVLAALWLAGVPVVSAQSVTDVPPAPAPVAASAPSNTLLDALACRTASGDLATLLQRLRRERPTEFTQTERQFSAPMMDLYRLAEPVLAWGHHSDAVVITDNRVLLLVDDSIEQAAAQLERALEDSRDAPLSGALDDFHALVVYPGEHAGLRQRTLIGCEYRMPGVSLLADPADAWRIPQP